MSTELIRLDLRLRRRMLIGTAVGAAAYLALIVAIYPSFRHDTSLDAMITANPAAAAAFGITGSITSPAGWLDANMYANFAPLLALLLTVGYGAAAIAGQDTDGLLGLEATLPVTRTNLVLQKALTLLLVALVVPAVSLAACLTGPYFELNPDWGCPPRGIPRTGIARLRHRRGRTPGGRLHRQPGCRPSHRQHVRGRRLPRQLPRPHQPTHQRNRGGCPHSSGPSATTNSSRASGWRSLAALGGLGLVLTGATVLAFRNLDIH